MYAFICFLKRGASRAAGRLGASRALQEVLGELCSYSVDQLTNGSDFCYGYSTVFSKDNPPNVLKRGAKQFQQGLEIAEHIISLRQSPLTKFAWRYGFWLSSYYTMTMFYLYHKESNMPLELPEQLPVNGRGEAPPPFTKPMISNGVDYLVKMIRQDRNDQQFLNFFQLLYLRNNLAHLVQHDYQA